MKFVKFNIIAFILFNCWIGVAQQLPQFTQYMYNTISINPAYAGSRETLSVVGLHRSQWVGLEGGPTTQTLSIHTPLRNEKIGLGLSIINDELESFDKTKNPAFQNADAWFFLAYKNDAIVGRIVVIINRLETNDQGIKKVRFGWFDFVDDTSVSEALLEKVAEIGSQHQLEYMEAVSYTHLTLPTIYSV